MRGKPQGTAEGDCDTGHPPACGDSRLLVISAVASRKLSGALSQARRTLPATS